MPVRDPKALSGAVSISTSPLAIRRKMKDQRLERVKTGERRAQKHRHPSGDRLSGISLQNDPRLMFL
ncbi:MAG: hypothetical protein JXA30_04450 [Deltaproteobacteria bacterium]|nr:hypothetical protein [Deltaproteobacteria bacterium]